MPKSINKKLSTLPTTPGIYQFLDSKENILYVGKAKSLRPRVRSYFRNPPPLRGGAGGGNNNKQPTTNHSLLPNHALDPSKQEMIKKIADIKTISTDTEIEALVLEANLIRKLQPPYNVLLRDDKFYLFIKITIKDKYPRVFPVRRIKPDRAKYFGPYSSAASVRHTLKLLRRIFPYRQEKDSPRDQIFPHPLFPLNKIGANTKYSENITHIIKFLQGHRQEISNTLKTGMKKSSAARQYERAAIFRDQLRAIERLAGNQKVYLPSRESFDVISIARKKSISAANIFSLRAGKLLNKNTFLLKHRSHTSGQDILRQFILQYYRVARQINDQNNNPPNIILLPHQLEDANTIAKWINPDRPPILSVPQRGQKKQLLNMGKLNAQQLLTQEEAEFITASHTKKALQELAQILGIKPHSTKASQLRSNGASLGTARNNPLQRIETYDISNIQGKLATGSMVVFTDGKPDKSQYKKFQIKTKDTPDDFHMMQEILTRRFMHLKPMAEESENSPPLGGGVRGGEEGKKSHWPLPDLVIIDGGKGQLNAAARALQQAGITISNTTILRNIVVPQNNSKISPSVALVSIAKREEELYIPGQSKPIHLPHDSPALFLIQQMRDEAHRFTITYHRLLRSKKQQRSLLDEVPGIGPATKKKLLNHFGSLKKIRGSSDQDISKIIGLAKTQTLRNYL